MVLSVVSYVNVIVFLLLLIFLPSALCWKAAYFKYRVFQETAKWLAVTFYLMLALVQIQSEKFMMRRIISSSLIRLD